MFCWNPIHLVDGEARWFLTFLLILTLAAVATHVWRWGCARLQKQFVLKNQELKEAAIAAAISPVAFYIWFVTIVKCFDLISDQLFSEGFTSELKLLYRLSAVLVLGWFLVRLKHNVTTALFKKSLSREIVLEPGKIAAISKLISALIFVLITLLLMEVTGISINAIIAFGGISGLAIAFASQELIANLFGGVMVHVVEPFAVGDRISLPGSSLEGKVEMIGWYETCLRGLDRRPIYIPNSLFSKSFVINGSRRTHRRLEEKVSVRHEDLSKVKAILIDIKEYLLGLTGIDTTEKIMVNVEGIGPYSVDLSIKALSYRVDEVDFYVLRDDVLLHIAQIISSHDAQLAVPVEAIRTLEK